ncbi:MAG TPA: hypothetical protein V6D12_19340 [Candidatus Obscuribacterales bacterium]
MGVREEVGTGILLGVGCTGEAKVGSHKSRLFDYVAGIRAILRGIGRINRNSYFMAFFRLAD